MKRGARIEMLVVVPAVVLAVLAWLFSEIRWARINDPHGKFTNVTEYVAWGRHPGHVTKIKRQGEVFFIAHSPMDVWLAMPSGPAAYVFDKSGRMIEWSRDSGDDPGFQNRWPLPHEQSSLEELRGLVR
jgi:hypothetical protein